MAKDNTLMYALMAVGGYFVYTYLRDTGALVEFGVAPAEIEVPELTGPPTAEQIAIWEKVQGFGVGLHANEPTAYELAVAHAVGKWLRDRPAEPLANPAPVPIPPPPAPTMESNLRARIINAAGGAQRLSFWQWGYLYEQESNGERSADPFTLPAFQGLSIPEVEARLLTYDEWAGYMSQAGYTGLSGRYGRPGMGAATYGGVPQGWVNGHDSASPWGQRVSGWGGQFNRG